MSRKLTTFAEGVNVNTRKVADHLAGMEENAAQPALVDSPPPAADKPAAQVKINRVRLNAVLPAELMEFYREKAYLHRMTVTDFVTHFMLDYMEACGKHVFHMRPKASLPEPEKQQ